MATLIPAILFGLAGLFIILYGLKLLLSNIAGGLPLRVLLERRKLQRKRALFRLALRRAADRDYRGALPLLRRSFMFDHVKHDPQLIERVQDHHLAVLEELITLSKKHPLPLSNLPIVEELIVSRSPLLKSFYETRTAWHALRRKRKGQRPPDWAVSEFERKLQDLKDKIATNTRTLEAELRKLFEGVQGGGVDEVVYH